MHQFHLRFLKKNIEQTEFTERTQLSQVQIARFETLAHIPSIEIVAKIENSLNLELTFIDKNTKNP
ncbi:helix-turn-helix domain-containing protein [Desemzia sp. FAM 24101]|uniref:helix-turn-helix domain-containing protein n=1 Tax=unclassified Desemzia TaxID=2685243 RepID=UPI00388A242F